MKVSELRAIAIDAEAKYHLAYAKAITKQSPSLSEDVAKAQALLDIEPEFRHHLESLKALLSAQDDVNESYLKSNTFKITDELYAE